MICQRKIYAWGDNRYGQLGTGDYKDKIKPTAIQASILFTSVAAGKYHSLALSSDGSVWSWGSNNYGQLGDGSYVNRNIPAKVPGLLSVIAISAGEAHSLALKSDGSVWTWGMNTSGQLGNGNFTISNTPVQVNNISQIKAIAAGYNHSMALSTTGVVWTWGSNEFGQLGAGINIDKRNMPIRVFTLTGVVNIGAGANHSLATQMIGNVWTWGLNSDGQLGDGTNVNRNSPVQSIGNSEMGSLNYIKSLHGGMGHSVALDSYGHIYNWGKNRYGVLGVSSTITEKLTPELFTTISGITYSASGAFHTLALVNNKFLYAWGNNSSGQCGIGHKRPWVTPTLIFSVESSGMRPLSADALHSLYVSREDGTVWAFGNNTFGQLGDGTQTNRTTPVQVQGLTGVKETAADEYSSFALRSDGTVWAWGENSAGQLGDGTFQRRLIPVNVFNNGEAIAAGEHFTLVIDKNGDVWSWGYNPCGQLGDGTNITRNVPAKISGLFNIIAIAAGEWNGMALQIDGSVWVWGGNKYGQMAEGNIDNPYVPRLPTKIEGLSDIVAISMGYFHAMALRSDGSVWSWGDNAYGELGDDTTIASYEPIQVQNIDNVVAIGAGGNQSVVLKNDGTVWMWGDNKYGQLGDGTLVERHLPAPVSGLSNITDIGPGDVHTLAVKQDGTLWSWGRNQSGELGDGTSGNSKSLPSQITTPN
ncbi:MAG: RCC1 repeat-containing protein [Candidatus Omnitrophota bacterium]|nr:RCC1 repeat-containing protein [Candidatus Omnitrophota bacterium]